MYFTSNESQIFDKHLSTAGRFSNRFEKGSPRASDKVPIDRTLRTGGNRPESLKSSEMVQSDGIVKSSIFRYSRPPPFKSVLLVNRPSIGRVTPTLPFWYKFVGRRSSFEPRLSGDWIHLKQLRTLPQVTAFKSNIVWNVSGNINPFFVRILFEG